MTVITLNHVSKFYPPRSKDDPGPLVAVDDVSLRLIPGEVLALLGPSGCGKTTLLRIVAGLLNPDVGEVLYDDVPLADIPRKERGIGMVFQDRSLVPQWTSRRNVGFFLELREREEELDDRIRRISEITGIGLDKLLERHPDKLSGGEQQRVSIARALARDLEVLLVDEPFANLDAKLRTQARVELKRLLGEFPVTTVCVTHDQVEAMGLANRIGVMREGRLEQVAPYRQLYNTPVNLFVASFIGVLPINLFEGRAVEGRWEGENFGPFPIRADLEEGLRVTLGVRPERILIGSEGVPGVVERVTPYYSERLRQLDVRVGQEQCAVVVPWEQTTEVGTTVCCRMEQDSCLFFECDMGRRIG